MGREEAQGNRDAGGYTDEPLYNIGVVSRMTGVPVATLRVWERRYSFPRTARSVGGHRIYSDHDVNRLRWLKARVDEGMQIGRAVKALEVAEAHGRLGPGQGRGRPLAEPEAAEPSLAGFGRQLAAFLRRNDTAAADRLLAEVLSLFPLEDLILEVLRPALADLGEGWQQGEVSVATEHLATHFMRQRLILWLSTGPATRPVPPVVLSCAPDEWHDASLLMLGVLLRRRGWPVAYLGQAVPLEDLAAFADDVRATAVVMVAMRQATAEALSSWPQWLKASARTGRPPVCYGGRPFTQDPLLRARVPGHYLGDSVQVGIQRLEDILQRFTGAP